MKLVPEVQRTTETTSTRVCSITLDGECVSLLDGSNWTIVGLNSYVSRYWKVGDEVVPAYDEIHHYRTNTRLHAHRTSRAFESTVRDRRQTA